MITEFAIAGVMVGIANKMTKYQDYNKWRTRDIKPFIKVFDEVCKKNETKFLLINGNITKYGAKLIISLKNHTYDELEKLQKHFEIEYKCDIELEQNQNKCTASLAIINNKLSDGFRYEPMFKLKPYELYFGLDNHFEPIISDLNDQPNVLFAGSTGKGKTQLMKMVLTNMIASNTERDINFYYCNINSSNDFKEFLNCSQTKSYTEDIKEAIITLDYLIHILNKRNKIFKNNDVIGIKEYNKKNHSKRMAYSILVLDEFTDYMPTTKLDPLYDEKIIFYEKLGHIIRKGRKCGIFTFACLQRSDTDSMKATLKSNFNIRIGFGLPNLPSSQVICDNGDCVNLPKRTFLFCDDGQRIWSKSLYIDDVMIKEMVKPFIISNRQSQPDFNVFLKEVNNSKEETSKVKSIKRAKKSTPKNEVATTDIKSTRVKNIEVLENIDYEVIDGKICLRMSNKISS